MEVVSVTENTENTELGLATVLLAVGTSCSTALCFFSRSLVQVQRSVRALETVTTNNNDPQ